MKAPFPNSYRGRKLDYASAQARCSAVAKIIEQELHDPKREKGVVRQKILECAHFLLDTLGFPGKIVSRYMKHAMPSVSPSTINAALPGSMKEPRMAAIALARETYKVTGELDIPSWPRSDDDFAQYEIKLSREQLPYVERAIAEWKRSASEIAILRVSAEDNLFMIGIPDSESEVE